VKVWDDGLPASLPVLAELDLPVAVPRATAVIAGWGVAVFPFVHGREADAPAPARTMRRMLDHPWIRDRRSEVEAHLERLEGAIERARATPRPDVICHTDFGGHNALVHERTGDVVAILDWDYARLAPREHDLWAAFEDPDPDAYLDAYGRDVELDATHLEYALLARAVRDATARVAAERDRAGVDTWGFDRWRRLDRNLALAGRRS
jgi:Ser/Thr protein kinase RdoA (MazF antagonist)